MEEPALPGRLSDRVRFALDFWLKALQQFAGRKFRDGPALPRLEIITGRGRHSVGNVAIVKPQVEALLSSAPYADLGATEDRTNPGRLVIPAANLKAWASER